MSRSSLLLVAAALAAGGFGCAHCDTCDDFPAPCAGPNCGSQGYPIGSEIPGGPIVPFPAGPSYLAPLDSPGAGPTAAPSFTPLPTLPPAESPAAPETPAPLPDSPPAPPDITSTPMR